MIDALAPDRVFPAPGGLRARVGAVALEIQTSVRDADAISKQGEPLIWTCVEIDGREIALPVMAGFADQERRDLYLLLRSLSGIGRASALLVLDCGEKIDILRAGAGGDRDFFKQVPGLGPKRIEAIISALQKKYRGDLPQALPLPVSEWIQARDALLSQGNSFDQAESLLHNSSGDCAQDLLKNI